MYRYTKCWNNQLKLHQVLSEIDAFDKFISNLDIFMLKNLLKMNYDILQQTRLSIFINAYTYSILYKNNDWM